MADTVADVRRDIEQTRERMSETLAQLEQKLQVTQIVRDHPWPALAAAVGAGFVLSGSRADVKAAGATLAATQGASSKLGSVLDDVVSQLVSGVHGAFEQRLTSLVDELKTAIGAPTGTRPDGATPPRAADLPVPVESASVQAHAAAPREGAWEVGQPITPGGANPVVGA